jgi:hypothetical protein
MGSHKVSMEQAAKELGRSLVGRVPHVVSVTIRRNSQLREVDLCVDIDSDLANADGQIPSNFKGYTVHIHRVGTPRFARTV